MSTKEIVMNEVFDFFIKSNDFNGIGLSSLAHKLDIQYQEILPVIEELINEDKVSIQAGENPHIVRIAHYNKEKQLECLMEAKENKSTVMDTIHPKGFDFEVEPIQLISQSHPRCIYPSEIFLKENLATTKYDSTPFTKRLAYGEAQLTPVYFELDVLERYSSDPRYRFTFEDYCGDISIIENSDSSSLKESDQVFLQTFGLGYDESNNRVAVAYLRYLSDLSPEHQTYWYTKMINSKCKMVKEYYANTIVGEWAFSQSLFSAVIEEQRLINEMSKAITTKALFRESFEERKRPMEFSFFNSPTLVNYERFISVLDKMISDNINKDFFIGKVEEYEMVTISEGVVERRVKGTLKLMEEWLRKHYTLQDEKGYDKLMKPLKDVRKERQSPAHKITKNHYDKNLYNKQMELLEQVYISFMNLRHIFHQHPRAAFVQIPDWIVESRIKNF